MRGGRWTWSVRSAVAGASTLALAASCDAKLAGSASPTAEAGAPQDAEVPLPGDGTAAPGPYRITCTFYARDLSVSPTPDFQEVQAIFHTDEPGDQSLDVAPGIPGSVSLAKAASAPDDVVLTIDLPASGLTRTFELSALTQPRFDLIGGEGFSGLNYVVTPNSTIDLQFSCEAGPYGEARPKPPAVGGGGPARGAPPAPLAIRCDVAGATGHESVTLDRTVTRAVTTGTEAAVNLVYVDGPPPVDPGFGDERTLVIQASRDVAHPDTVWVTQVAYQLNPSRPLTNPLRGPAALTGTVSLRAREMSGDAGGTDAGALNAMTVGCTIP